MRPWTADHQPHQRPSHGAGSPLLKTLPELGQQPDDYDVPKHRWSAFHGTHLALSLRTRAVDTILLIGGSTHVGIAATAYDARDQDLSVVLARDALTGFPLQREFFLDQVFPRMTRIRTVDEILAALRST
jgi:nicotinamidase-related amidase